MKYFRGFATEKFLMIEMLCAGIIETNLQKKSVMVFTLEFENRQGKLCFKHGSCYLVCGSPNTNT